MHCREWPAGKADWELKLFIEENGKPRDPVAYTYGSVHQSGWGFTVKQGETTTHNDS